MMRCIAIALSVLALCAGVQAAPERVTPFMKDMSGQTLPGSHCWASGGARVNMLNNALPIVDYQGRRAVRFSGTHPGTSSFGAGFVPGSWVRFYLDSYGPTGALEFDVAGHAPGSVSISMDDPDMDGPGPDEAHRATIDMLKFVTPGKAWQHVRIPLSAFTDAEPAFEFFSLQKVSFGAVADGGETDLYLADMKFTTTSPERPYPPIKIDQVGYPTGWRKVAKVTPRAPLSETAFRVLAQDGAVALEGRLAPASLQDESSGDIVYDADFTAVTAPGTYVLDVPGVGRSGPIRVGDSVYDRLLYDVRRMYFFQRCGQNLPAECAGPCAHRACHLVDRETPDPHGGTRDCSGGWHDAGDMNRYSPWINNPVNYQLLLYRHWPQALASDQLNIPESGNGVPDLLDEVKHELLWARKMLIRDGADRGKVYDRLHQSGVRQPQGVGFFDRRSRLWAPTDEAACVFVAIMSHAYLVYKDFAQEAAFADECLADALVAWDYLQTRGDALNAERHFTAATFLFEATGRADAHEVVRHCADEVLGKWRGHINYGNFDLALAVYALSERPEVDAQLQQRMREYHRRYCDDVLRAMQSKGYNEPMMPGVLFIWGCNGNIAKSDAHLLLANRHSPNPAYVAAARDVLHWLLGRNAISQCMVSGYGEPGIGFLYHSMFNPEGPVPAMPPGYLAGGPNVADCPGISAWPAKAWRSDRYCYQLTEPSLSYQAPLVYLLGALTAMDAEAQGR